MEDNIEIIILVIHFLLLFKSFYMAVPTKIKENYIYFGNKLTGNTSNPRPYLHFFPISLLIQIITIILLIIFIFSCKPYYVLDNLINKTSIIYLSIIFTIIFIPNTMFSLKDYEKLDSNTKKEKPLLLLGILLFLYSSSTIISYGLIYISNYIFDNPILEEINVTVKAKDTHTNTSYTKRGTSKSTHYHLKIEPDIHGIKSLEVSRLLYNNATAGKKIKVKIQKGLFNVRYLSKDYELIN